MCVCLHGGDRQECNVWIWFTVAGFWVILNTRIWRWKATTVIGALKEIFKRLSQAKTSASGWRLVWPAQCYRDWAMCPRVPKKWAMPWARSMPCSSANDALCLERTKKRPPFRGWRRNLCCPSSTASEALPLPGCTTVRIRPGPHWGILADISWPYCWTWFLFSYFLVHYESWGVVFDFSRPL